MDRPQIHETAMPTSATGYTTPTFDPAFLAMLPRFPGPPRPASVVSRPERFRLMRHANVDRASKKALGQFLTSSATAHFAASLFEKPNDPVRLLDAGAGAGALLAAVLERFGRVEAADAIETDPDMLPPLSGVLASARRKGARVRYVGDCFLSWGLDYHRQDRTDYTHAILNPPYQRMSTKPDVRFALRKAGMDVSNTYTAFVALVLKRLVPGGELVAILPRSFLTGSTHAAFRRWLLDRAALTHVHVYGSRNAVFSDDDVLQEIVVVHLRRGVGQGHITVSTSTDDTMSDFFQTGHCPSALLRPGDPECRIRIPDHDADVPLDARPGFDRTLSDLGVSVSTGPIIRSRVLNHLRPSGSEETHPLLHTRHHAGSGIEWPNAAGSDEEALSIDAPGHLTYPVGDYVLVRRYSFKEGARRVMPALLRPEDLPEGTTRISVQDKFNVLHIDRGGLPGALALGLTAYLGTSLVEAHVRSLSGTTQINAVDLRTLPCPSVDVLCDLGKWAATQEEWPDAAALDDRLQHMMETDPAREDATA